MLSGLLKTNFIVGISSTILFIPSVQAQTAPSHLPERTESANASNQQGLTLPEALALALQNNPHLTVFDQAIRMEEAKVLQAGLLPNPVLNVSASNFGNNRLQDFDSDTVHFQLSQLIELGGKRLARIEKAQAKQVLANWDYEIQRIEILTRVRQSFAKLLALQQQLKLVGQSLELAEQISATVANQVTAGKVSPIESTRLKVSLASARTDRQRTEAAMQAARFELAVLLGQEQPAFNQIQGKLSEVRRLPALQQLKQRLQDNPDLKRWHQEIEHRQKQLTLEKAKAIPDLTVNVGANQYLEPNEYGLNVGVSLPLPLFNANQGSIRAAEHQQQRAVSGQDAAELQLNASLTQTYYQLNAISLEVETYQNTILPNAEKAYQAVHRGYQLGKFALMDVLDTQRTLFQAKADYLRALAAYQNYVAEIERLLGGSLFGDS